MPKRSPLKLLDYLCLLSSVRKYLSNVWSIYMNYASPFGGQSVSLIVYHFIVKVPLKNCVYLTYMSICDCSVGNCVTELPRNSTSGIMSNGNKITYIQWFKTHTKLNNNISHSDRYLSQSTRLCYQFGATSASSRHLTIVFFLICGFDTSLITRQFIVSLITRQCIGESHILCLWTFQTCRNMTIQR